MRGGADEPFRKETSSITDVQVETLLSLAAIVEPQLGGAAACGSQPSLVVISLFSSLFPSFYIHRHPFFRSTNGVLDGLQPEEVLLQLYLTFTALK